MDVSNAESLAAAMYLFEPRHFVMPFLAHALGTLGLGNASAMGTTRRRDKAKEESASRLIDQRIQDLGDWRGKMLTEVRALIHAADPDVVEEWKWDVPVWSHDGIICTGETYKKAVKLTFANGAALDDSAGLFNSSLGGNTRRAIDIHEGEKIDGKAFKALIRSAVRLSA